LLVLLLGVGLLGVLELRELRQLMVIGMLLVVEGPSLLLLLLWSLVSLYTIRMHCTRNFLYQCTHVGRGRM
jgi:hypothetical protein